MGLDPRTPGSRPGPKAGAKPLSHPGIPKSSYYEAGNKDTVYCFIYFFKFYLFIHERHREREAETQAEGEAGSTQGA